ncbi:glycosyltransferase family 4 protein [Ekhidna sp. To15]|uniref:glycosyltransferase family 4 protein n=1 Tax=Ekhidna sp. To15 TaxID=3395267 RepID=UPI003F5235EA
MKSSSEKHILILTPGFPESEEDSACIPALQIYMKALKATGKLGKISVIAFQYPYASKAFVWNKIRVYPLNGRNRRRLFKPLVWIRALYTFLKINKKSKVDLIHSFWYSECAFVGSIIYSIFKVPHVSTFMGQDALSPNKFTKIMLKKPFVVSLSQFHEETIRQNLNIASNEIIPWGIDKSEFENEFKSDRPIDVLGVGSLIPLKNYSLFIEVIHDLVGKGNQLKCIILGAGPEYEILNDKIAACNLSETIELKGEVDRQTVLDYMNQSKVLLHTSGYESFGMVFIEALHSGVKVVSKPVGCFQESDTWKTGESKGRLVEAVSKFLLNNDVRHLQSGLDISNTIDSYLTIYEKVQDSTEKLVE